MASEFSNVQDDSDLDLAMEGSFVELHLPVVQESQIGAHLIVGDSESFVSPILQQLTGYKMSNVTANGSNRYKSSTDLIGKTNASQESSLNSQSPNKGIKKINFEPSAKSNDLNRSSPSIISQQGFDFYTPPSIFSTQSSNNPISSPTTQPDTQLFNSQILSSDGILRKKSSIVENINEFSSPSKLWNTNHKLEVSNTFQNETFDMELKSSCQDEKFETYIKPDLYNVKLKSEVKPPDSTSKPLQFCPQCKSKYSEERALRYFHVSLEYSVLLCSSEKCTYPFDTPSEILQFQKESIEDILQSEIDFDIGNISVNTKIDNEKLLKLQDLVPSFLSSVNNMKRAYERLQSNDFTLEEYQVGEDNEKFANFINQAIESAPESNLNEGLKMEAVNTLKSDVDLDGLLEEQNREIREMLENFV